MEDGQFYEYCDRAGLLVQQVVWVCGCVWGVVFTSTTAARVQHVCVCVCVCVFRGEWCGVCERVG